MAKLDRMMIKSTAPGKHWSLSSHDGTISAIEGELEESCTADGKAKWTSFTFTMFEGRSTREPIRGRAVAKNVLSATRDMLSTLRLNNCIDAPTYVKAMAEMSASAGK